MDSQKRDWTHTKVAITDIRKLSEFYIFTISDSEIKSALIVKGKIFEDRLEPYFLKEARRVTRDEILSVCWNMFITKGYYVKIGKDGEQRFQMDADKWYVSYLEIDGPLGTFQSVYKDHTSSFKEHN